MAAILVSILREKRTEEDEYFAYLNNPSTEKVQTIIEDLPKLIPSI